MKKWFASLLLFAFPCVTYGVVYQSYYSSFSSITTYKRSINITIPTPQPTSLCWDDYEFNLATDSNNFKVLLKEDLETATSMINNINNSLDAYLNYMDSYERAINSACNSTWGPMSENMCNIRKQQAMQNNPPRHSSYINNICTQRSDFVSFMHDAIQRWTQKMENTINNIKKWLSSGDKAANEWNYTKAINDYEEAIPYLRELDWMEPVIQQIKSTINDLQQLKDKESAQKIEDEWNKLTEQYNEAMEYTKEWNYDKAITILEEILKNEWKIEWGDNYSLARKALSINKEWKKRLEEWKKQQESLPELNQAINWMYEKWLTIFNDPVSFMASNWLRRDEASKFFVKYAKEVMWMTPDYSKQWCSFKDLDKARPDLKDVIVEACQLWLFQWYKWNFMPTQQLTNAQALTVFMRLREWYKDESWNHFANNYYESAHAQGLLFDTPLDNKANFDINTTRWDVAKMLFRGRKN